MNLDAVVNHLEGMKTADGRRVAGLVSMWKSSDDDVTSLAVQVRTLLASIQSVDPHIVACWKNFEESCILGIGGMTMNECLYWFGLLDCVVDDAIYRKLEARR
jgi:hypothetical protein